MRVYHKTFIETFPENLHTSMMRQLRYIVSGRAIITTTIIFRFYAHVYVFSSEYAVQVFEKLSLLLWSNIALQSYHARTRFDASGQYRHKKRNR